MSNHMNFKRCILIFVKLTFFFGQHTGEILYNRKYTGKAYHKQYVTGEKMCGGLCKRISNCVAFNFYYEHLLCVIMEETDTARFVFEEGTHSADISLWSEPIYANKPCTGFTCPQYTECVPLTKGKPYCLQRHDAPKPPTTTTEVPTTTTTTTLPTTSTTTLPTTTTSTTTLPTTTTSTTTLPTTTTSTTTLPTTTTSTTTLPTTTTSTTTLPTTTTSTTTLPTTTTSTTTLPTTTTSTTTLPTTTTSTTTFPTTTTTTTTLTTTTTQISSSGDGYNYDKDRVICYKLHTEGQTWYDASKVCQSEGGELAKLDTEQKALNLARILYKAENIRYYIGLNDEATEGKWVWRDGTPVTYTNWRKNGNQPNNKASGYGGKPADCVTIRIDDGQWTDEYCQAPYGFVCERNI